MAPPEFTTIMVRGKRRACSAEKWRAGERRKPKLRTRPQPTTHAEATSSRASSSRPQKRRQRQIPDTPLEALPAEILQEIFEYAGNVDLAMVSRQLALKLSKSNHLHHELTTRLLQPVLHDFEGAATDAERAAATRLLDSRFMTWNFFKDWLRSYIDAPQGETGADSEWHWHWRHLLPSPELLPPKKLLLPPFTEANVSFLAVLAQNIVDIHALDAAYGELAQDGLTLAVNEANLSLVSLLLKMGTRSSTELLRVAVADCGCNEKIVEMLIRGPDLTASSRNVVDALDPVLWQWAEKDRQQGNTKGEWLIALLKEEQRRDENQTSAMPPSSGQQSYL